MSALAGWIADQVAWSTLFFLSSLMTFPCLILLYRLYLATHVEEEVNLKKMRGAKK
jgi:predicted MFS family arabinose efflux permease